MKYIILKTEEIGALELLLKTKSNNSIRKRSQCLLLFHQKRTIIDLSVVFGVSRRTIEQWFDSWVLKGIESLNESCRGVKTRLKGYEKNILSKLSFTAEI